MAWDQTVPTTGSYIVDLPSIYRNNWIALDNIVSVEHYMLTETLSGRHDPLLLPIMGSTETSGITAISSPATGGLHQDTTLGLHVVYDGNAWQQINLLSHSRVHAYRNDDYIVTASTTAVVPFDTEVFDDLDEYDASTNYIFMAKSTGFYYIRCTASFTTIGGTEVNIQIAQYNTSDQMINTSTYMKYALSSDEFSMGTTGFLYLLAGEKIKINTWHNATTSIVLEGGLDRNFLNIYRLS